ncbi:MAG: MgtE intracellular region [Bryobacterales bacterium]|jgi:CBS domain-containing protein|nr:MgtE intracellular region [Bryobacterales bacterium]
MTPETLNHIFFTELLGMPVFDLKHRRIARVKDAAVVPLIHSARIDRFLVSAGGPWLSVRYDQIASISLRHGIQLSNERLYPYHSDEYMLRMQRDLLDQQIIDVNGRKVVRVNDVTLEVRRDDRDCLLIYEIDVGVRSVFRRLVQGLPSAWVRGMQKAIPPNSIRWEFCNIVEADPLRRLRLNISHDRLELMHPADLADIVEELGPAEREAIIGTLDSEVAAEALSEIDPKMQATILEALEPEVAADIVEEMSPDQAADALGQMEDETTEEIIDEMDEEPGEEVRELMEYDEDTAGGMMNTEAILMPLETTLDDALKKLRDHEDLLESTHVLFLTSADGKVTAAVPLARLFLADGATPLSELAVERLIATKPSEKKNRVAELFDKYNLLALPVLEEDGTLAGVITADDIIAMLRKK